MAGKAENEEKSKRPADTAFKQQNLKAWRPILTPKTVILTFFIVGILFVPIGAAVLVTSSNVRSCKLQWSPSARMQTRTHAKCDALRMIECSSVC